MKVASATATRVHHRLAIALLRRLDRALYGSSIRCTCTLYLYAVPVRCTLNSMDCTAYSCQVAQVKAALPKTADGERTRLSRSAVAVRALQLADAEGIEALTIRRLAQELGVTPMALYWHFRNKEELINGLADQIWREVKCDIDPGARWWDQLRYLLQSLVDVLRVHPSASELLIGSDKFGEAVWEVNEVALEVLRTAG